MAGLNPKQAVFVAAYIGEAKENATEAARIAGYKQPHVQGSQLLANISVKAAVAEHLAEVKRQGIALKQNRIDALVHRHELMNQVIAERAAHAWTADVPGGSTGLVVKQLKHVKHTYDPDPDDEKGEPRTLTLEVWESAVDTGLLKELREHEKQTAQEVGDWVERGELTGKGGGPLEFAGIDVPLPSRPDEPSA